jgi:hypothetical protein
MFLRRTSLMAVCKLPPTNKDSQGNLTEVTPGTLGGA